ncbi:lytic transglycosylase domain-containing protein [Roseomonas sp. HJA6]|uniref:Lytic transglycosylase domain-containing protein n=1 Tax=Roseomonas alba TaxID=2846776 RepID=A0ABS7A697_9PROT|nr:lytic transglycosylase domain-containing protein [Neoroseomonas alba]MBW6397620.1 lytic transglycosylase domain-containing protein [Neoroseomonas alba]
MAALSRTFDSLSRTFADVGRTAADDAAEQRFGQAREEALTAPIRDEAGNYTVPAPDWSTRAGRMSAETFLGRIVDEEQVAARERAVRIRAEVNGDPEQFNALWRADMEGRRASIPAHAWERVQPVLRQVGVDHLNSQRMEVVQRAQRAAEVGWRDALGALNDDAQGLARAGEISGSRFADVAQRYEAHLDRGVREGQISPESRQVMLGAFRERTGGQALFRSVLERLDAGDNPDEVTRTFEREMDGFHMPPAARNNLRSMLRTAIGEHHARQAYMRSELREEIDGWRRVNASGLTPFDAGRGEDLIRRAEAAGDTGLASALRRQQQAFAETASVATVSLPDVVRRQNEALTALQQAPDDAARQQAFERLTTLRQVERVRREQMEADPLGTAMRVHRGKPGVGELQALEYGNVERLGQQLAERRRQAGMLASVEGLSATSMPVITAAEAEVFRRVITDTSGDRGEAAQRHLALLRAMAPMGADRMMATLEAIMPGRQTDASPRVQAFVAAGSLALRDRWDVAARILDGTERMRAMGQSIPALSGPDAARRIEQQTGVAYQFIAPAAVTAMQSAVRAVYVSLAARGDIVPGQRLSEAVDPPALTGRLDTALLSRAIQEVMPTVTFNGRATAAPRGMSQVQFDEEMSRLTWGALNGARARSGQPVQPWMVRQFGDLVAVSQDRYLLYINGFHVLGPDGGPFYLDMSRSWRRDGPGFGPTAINPAALSAPVAQAIATAADRNGVPVELAQRVAMQESGGQHRRADGTLTRSPVGATGLMQLMPDTARGLGVNVEDEGQNIEGGVRYLGQMMQRFGDPVLATAAYNWGPERVERWRARGMPFEQLPAETRTYLERIWGRPVVELFPPRLPRRQMSPAGAVQRIPGWDDEAAP